MATILTLPVVPNEAYTADSVDTSVTLYELLEAIQDAIAHHGPEALVVLDNGQKYGAQFGAIEPASRERDWFQKAEDND
jgi:hypothetical protein